MLCLYVLTFGDGKHKKTIPLLLICIFMACYKVETYVFYIFGLIVGLLKVRVWLKYEIIIANYFYG